MSYYLSSGNSSRMAEAKIVWVLLANLIGIPFYVYAFVANFDSIKSTVLFILAVLGLMVRGYFFIVQKRQAIREKEYELWDKEQTKRDKIKSP